MYKRQELDGDKTGNIAGGRGSSLQLVEALNMGPEVPHPLCKPWIVGVSVVGRDPGAAQVKGALNCRIKFGDKAIRFFGSHGERDKDVGSREGSSKHTPLCPVPGACGGH